MRNFEHVRAEKCEVDRDKKCSDRQSRRSRPVPSSTSHDIKQNRSDQHGGRNRHAVSRREITRCSKAEDKRNACDHQTPIHHRHIDLSDNPLRCIDGP